jgi:hypothetical protein
VKGLLERLLAQAEIAGAVLPAGDFRGRFGCVDHLHVQLDRLAIADQRIVGALDIGNQRERMLGDFQARALQLVLREIASRGQREHAEKILEHGELAFHAPVAVEQGETERRIVQQAGLHQVGTGDAGARQLCAQRAVVEQRNGDRLVAVQSVGEQCLHAEAHRRGVRLARLPAGLRGALGHLPGDILLHAVRRGGGAGAEQQRDGRGHQSVHPVHGCASW